MYMKVSAACGQNVIDDIANELYYSLYDGETGEGMSDEMQHRAWAAIYGNIQEAYHAGVDAAEEEEEEQDPDTRPGYAVACYDESIDKWRAFTWYPEAAKVGAEECLARFRANMPGKKFDIFPMTAFDVQMYNPFDY